MNIRKVKEVAAVSRDSLEFANTAGNACRKKQADVRAGNQCMC